MPHMSVRRWVATAAAALAVAACAGVPDVLQGLDGAASARQLNGPWQPQPMRVSAQIVAEADRVCRADIPFQAGLPLLVVDARGEGRLELYYGAPNGGSGECNGIFVGLDGRVRPGGSGGSGSGEAWPPIAAGALLMQSSGWSGGEGALEEERHVAGRAGAGVVRVHVRVAGHAEHVEATVANGWWAAWWPRGGACTGLVALDSTGAELSRVASC
jgi:hypothetical protein